MKKLPMGLLLALPILGVGVATMVVTVLLDLLADDLNRNELEQTKQSARTIALVLEQHPTLILDHSARRDAYVVEPLPRSPELDGRDDDWPPDSGSNESLGLSHLIEIESAYETDSLLYQLRMGRTETDLYVFYRVKDNAVVYRELNNPSVHRNDHVQIAFNDGQGSLVRYTIAVFQPGHVEAMQLGRSGRALRADAEIMGRWLATETGYNLEIKIPLKRMSNRFSTLVADVDDPVSRSIQFLVGKSRTDAAEFLGILDASPSELQQVMAQMNTPARITSIDGRLMAETIPGPSARSSVTVPIGEFGELTMEASPVRPSPLDVTGTRLLLLMAITLIATLGLMWVIGNRTRANLSAVATESARLRHYNEYLERMASRLNHELQTPVSVVRSSLEHLRALVTPGGDATYLDRATEGIERLTNILNKMSEARRLEETLDEDEIVRFNLVDVIEGCVAGYRLAFPDHNFELSVEATDVPVTGIPELVAQAFDKLIDNAVEFSGDAQIRVRLNIESGEAAIRVFNAGERLPAGDADRLFESMVSVRAADNSDHLGLGLYVARTIAEYHGGSLSLSNREDVDGVVATVRLPILRLSTRLR